MRQEQDLVLGLLIKNLWTAAREIFPVPPRCRLYVGRSEDCEIWLRGDPSIRRKRCVVTADDRDVYLEDYVDDKFPVWVNGEVLAGVRRLEAGDVITVGRTDLLFQVPGTGVVPGGGAA